MFISQIRLHPLSQTFVALSVNNSATGIVHASSCAHLNHRIRTDQWKKSHNNHMKRKKKNTHRTELIWAKRTRQKNAHKTKLLNVTVAASAVAAAAAVSSGIISPSTVFVYSFT